MEIRAQHLSVPDAPDCEELARLHATSFTACWSSDSFRDLLSITGTWVVMVDTVGFGMVRCQYEVAEILTLAVVPDARKQGIATQIVMALAELARSKGAQTLFLEVREQNQAARALYRRAGFHESGQRRAYYSNPDGSSEDACILSKIL